MNSWVLVDTETDGLYNPIHTLEIAAQLFVGTEPIGAPFRVFLDHDIEIPPIATSVHGYDRVFLKKHGVTPSDAHEEFRKYVSGHPICAHYIAFDWNRVLYPEWERLGIDMIGNKGFCTWKVIRRLLCELPCHKLDFLRQVYNLNTSKAHTAIGDVEDTTLLLTNYVFPQLKSIGIDDYTSILKWSDLSILECKCIISGLDYRTQKIREKESKKVASEARKLEKITKDRLERFCDSIRAGGYALPTLINEFCLIEEYPNLKFEGKAFLFTGKMAWGSRSMAQSFVESKGGIVSLSRQFSAKIDYLVLGEDNDRGWKKLANGTKLTDAFIYKLKNPFADFKIVLESDFICALY